MLDITNYQITEKIYESLNSLIYRALVKETEQSVILKVLKENYPTASELIRYKQEYTIISSLQSETVIKAYERNSLKLLILVFLPFSLEKIL